jgi:hypothetical protein
MHFKKLVIMAALTTLTLAGPAYAQNGNPDISAVTLQVVPGQGGGESVVTPRGMVVPLPGPGVNTNSVQIFMGSQGGYWYVDRNGQNVDLTAAVERFRQMTGQAGNMPNQMNQAQIPQYAAAPPVNVYNEQAPSNSSSGSGAGSTLVTATAAGLGAMAGSAMTNSYYNNGYYHGVPYGTPVYYPHGGNPYYRGNGGNTVNVDHTYNGGNNTANVNNGAVNTAHANSFQKQQDWYANQQKQNPSQFQNWQKSASGENPFVNRGGDAQGGGFADRRNAAQGNAGEQGGRHGLFNRGGGEANAGAATNAGGRFNRGGGAQPEAQGGRFGNAAGGGGRFGGRRGR